MSSTRAMASACFVIATITPAYGVWTWATLDFPGSTYTGAYGISEGRIVGICSTNLVYGFLYY